MSAAAFRDPGEVYAFLDRYLNFERKLEPKAYRLDRMEALKDMFGAPDSAYRVVHVAGSKGKGSTATMIASILTEGGERTGLYTSPHLLSFTERIAVDGVPVDERVLLESASELASGLAGTGPDDYPGGENPTYFELLTLLGFLCFRNAGCTSAVIEVGLGGRLDSTNVVFPVACAITPIELEHTELLGDTIAAIAREKAGILKPGVPAYTSSTRPDALEVIRNRAAELSAPLTVLDEAVELENILVSRTGTSARLRWKALAAGRTGLTLDTPLIGTVQARNAALASLLTLGLGYGEETVLRGLKRARLRARFEVIEADGFTAILDGAHTEDSIKACVDDFSRIFPGGGLLLFGCAKGKPPRPMAAALRKAFGEVVLTRPGTFKESDPDETEAAFLAEGFAVTRVDDTEAAVETAASSASKRGLPLLVTGSFYLCGAAAASKRFGAR